MQRRAPRLSRPVYESLPWAYVACGVVALLISYFLESRILSLLTGLVGLAGLLGGIVVLLRRRDYREMRSRYADPGALADEESD